jgi:hypothetical protein
MAFSLLWLSISLGINRHFTSRRKTQSRLKGTRPFIELLHYWEHVYPSRCCLSHQIPFYSKSFLVKCQLVFFTALIEISLFHYSLSKTHKLKDVTAISTVYL